MWYNSGIGRGRSHPARGAWIEIPAERWTLQLEHGSHPARGAWIEISGRCRKTGQRRSHPARGAWIEIAAALTAAWMPLSHPARGAWIEIVKVQGIEISASVAPRKGCVD